MATVTSDRQRVRLKTSLVGERFEAHAGEVVTTTRAHAAKLIERDLAEAIAEGVETAAFDSPELAARVGRPAARRRG